MARKPRKKKVAAKATTPAPAKPGRPTKYDPAMCAKVIECGEKGFSKAMIARELGVDRDTVKEWVKEKPAFSAAIKRAQDLALAWWEENGQAGIHLGKDFNSTAFIFQMKNRFRDDYADNINHKHDATDAFLRIWAAEAEAGAR